MKDKLVSVIVPVYRVEKYINRCIDSILEQTYKKLEIILIDDGSDDKCPEICDEYGKMDSRIKVIHKLNGGLSEARNIGIDSSKGEYVAFVDSDDYLHERYIEIMYSIAEQTQSDIVQCGFCSVLDDDEIIDCSDLSFTLLSPRQFSIQTYTLMGWKGTVAWNKLYRREMFGEIRYPIGKIHEDDITTYKLIWKATNIANINSKLYYYRQREDSIMGEKYSLKHLDAQLAYKGQEQFYFDNGDDYLLSLVRCSYAKWLRYQIQCICMNDVDKSPLDELHDELDRLERISNLQENNITQIHGFIFPFSRVQPNESIILYGAGDVGRQFFKQIIETAYCSILFWVDSNTKVQEEVGYPIKTFDQIRYTGERIVISINNNEIARDIIRLLQNNYGVPRNKIIYEVRKI